MTSLTSWPFNNGEETSETEFSMLFRELQDTGVADTANGTGFKVTASGSGMQVSVAAGFAIVRGFAVLSEGIEVVLIDPADLAARTDIVVLRLDPENDKIDLAVVKGTPGSGVPALTQTDTLIYELPLARVTVGASVTAIAGAAVTEARRFLGTRVLTFSSDTQPASARLGQLAFNTSTSSWVFWNGTAWTDLIQSISWDSLTGKPATFPHDTITWGEVSGKPSTFTPSAHGHDWDEISGKPGSYPPSGHSHSFASITSRPSTYPPSAHYHDVGYITGEGDWTVGYANGSKRVAGHSPSGSGWYSVWVDGNDLFCHNTSSRRYKENIESYRIDPEKTLALRPVVYDRIGDDAPKNELGLIAEEVFELVPELVVYDREGQIESLRYDLLAVALLDVVKDLNARVAELEAR